MCIHVTRNLPGSSPRRANPTELLLFRRPAGSGIRTRGMRASGQEDVGDFSDRVFAVGCPGPVDLSGDFRAGSRRRKPATDVGMFRTSAGPNTGNAVRVRHLSISVTTTLRSTSHATRKHLEAEVAFAAGQAQHVHDVFVLAAVVAGDGPLVGGVQSLGPQVTLGSQCALLLLQRLLRALP